MTEDKTEILNEMTNATNGLLRTIEVQKSVLEDVVKLLEQLVVLNEREVK